MEPYLVRPVFESYFVKIGQDQWQITLGEPFDFLTWFEYAPADAEVFEELVGTLRETEEWTYVEREVDIRLVVGD